jgi:ASCH domain-containing protein
MKALTIQPPMSSAIITGIKTVENRSWATNYTGPLAIHAGKKPWPHHIDIVMVCCLAWLT